MFSDITSDIKVTQYGPGYYKSYTTRQLDFGKIGLNIGYASVVLLIALIGAIMVITAPLYMYSVFIIANANSQLKMAFALNLIKIVDLVKLKWARKFKIVNSSWSFGISYLSLGLIYLYLTYLIAFVFFKNGDYFSIFLTAAFMLVSSTIFGKMVIPTLKEEFEFEMLVTQFEAKYSDYLLPTVKEAKEKQKQFNINTDEYKAYVLEKMQSFHDHLLHSNTNKDEAEAMARFLGVYLMSVKNKPYLVQYKQSPTLITFITMAISALFAFYLGSSVKEDKVLQSLRMNPDKIITIENPTIAMQVEAAVLNPELIRDTDKIDREAYVEILKRNFSAIKYIPDYQEYVDEQFLADMVYEHPEYMKYINNPTEKIIDSVRNSPNKYNNRSIK